MMFVHKDPVSGVPAVQMENVFIKKDIGTMIENVKKNVPAQAGEHMYEGKITTKEEKRLSTVRWFMDPGFEQVLRSAIDIANYTAGWKYDIVKPEMLQFTEYEPGGHYNWHTDGQCDHPSARVWAEQDKPQNLRETKDPLLLGTVRKISASVILNEDYEGGEMQFRAIDDHGDLQTTSIKPKTGSVLVFPSCVHHRVAPVTKGTRYSVVAWYGGPPFK